MKQVIFIATILFSVSSYGQKVDTIKNSIQINPVVINPLKSDTAYQLFWRVSVDRGGENRGYAVMYDRLGNKTYDFNFIVPQDILNKWLDDSVIDNFILNKYNLTLRK